QPDRRLVLGGGEGGHGVLDEDEVVAEVGGGPGGGLDAEVGGDAAEHQGGDAAFAQPLVQAGALEGADGPLDHLQVAGPSQAGHEPAAGRLFGDRGAFDPGED